MAQAYIVKRPGTVGGKPTIAGTRIKVSEIVLNYLGAGNSIAEILRRYPHLTPAQLHSALAYFYDHPDEILQELFDELTAIRHTLSAQELHQLCDQLVPLILEGLRFSAIYDQPDQAREEPGAYLLLKERVKSRFQLLDVGASAKVRSALQAYSVPSGMEIGTIRYAVRYAPLAESQDIAEQIRHWLRQTAIQE